MTATRKVAHRASFLQAFHSGISESQRKANIEAAEKSADKPLTEVTVTVGADETGTRKKLAGQRSGRGYVHEMSDAQERFIISLINNRDLSNLNILPGQTIDPAQVKTMGKKSASALIEKLLNCPEKPRTNTIESVKVTNQGSDKQRSYLKSLMAKHNLTESDINSTYSNISDAIGTLKVMPVAKNEESITEGAYWHNGLIARVQMSRQSKRLYVKLQTEVGGNEFEYAPGVINLLKAENRLSLSEMQAFAQQYSACADCGTKMTNPISIARGVGPVCSGKGYTL